MGAIIMYNPDPKLGWYLLSNHEVELSYGKWIAGPGLFFWGVYWLIKGKKSKYVEIHYKCLNCGKVFKLEQSTNNSCKTCSKPLEELEGFFERHPEYKDES